MEQNRPLAALLTAALVLAVLVLLLVGGSLVWLDAEGAEEEFPEYRLRLTCPENMETYDRPLDARVWPAGCGASTWLPVVERY